MVKNKTHVFFRCARPLFQAKPLTDHLEGCIRITLSPLRSFQGLSFKLEMDPFVCRIQTQKTLRLQTPRCIRSYTKLAITFHPLHKFMAHIIPRTEFTLQCLQLHHSFLQISLHAIAQGPPSMCRFCWSWNCYCMILQWSKSTVEHSSRCAVQEMMKSRELAEQMTGWQSNPHVIMACILEDLKSWGGFDATCVPAGTKLRIPALLITCRKEV